MTVVNLLQVHVLETLAVVDDHGRERERYKIPYGAELSVEDGSRADAGQIVANWDPHSHPVITEVAGTLNSLI